MGASLFREIEIDCKKRGRGLSTFVRGGYMWKIKFIGGPKAENELLRGQIAALRQQRDGLLKALENCRLLAARHRKEEWATHILRFCGESGVIGSPIRDNVIASVEGETKCC